MIDGYSVKNATAVGQIEWSWAATLVETFELLNRTTQIIVAASFVCLSTADLFAAGGTRPVAFKGQPAYIPKSWPKGVDEVVNDSTRTFGLNSWFSEWPNDVNQYGFEIKSTDDVNRLIEKLSAINCELRQIRLSHLKEPQGLGWTTEVPMGNNIAILFSIGDQSQLDEWYKRLRQPFGQMEFTSAPIAVPPTLTIFVQNPMVKLDELKIPDGIVVQSGYAPQLFHRSNIKGEVEKQDDTDGNSLSRQTKENTDLATQAAIDKIRQYLKGRKSKLR